MYDAAAPDWALFWFVLQTTTGSEERIQALLRNANSRLLSHPEARRRLLQLKAPTALVPYQGELLLNQS